MKFSEAWLREYVNPDMTTKELVARLTMAGLEVEGFEPVAADFEHVVVGEVLELAPHPDADKLVVCKVSDGTTIHQVVCGAPNVRAGLKVPLALIGAVLGELKIKKARLRGVESSGMLCSERELGISDSHAGLLELADDAPVGTDIRRYLQLDDTIIELDLTPNRSDCLGMVGLARETGLISNVATRLPEIVPVQPRIDARFPVELAAAAACPRFVGRVISGLRLDAATPVWMKEKLRRAGVRSIDPVVDVTNFVMMELGQPMHAYDLDKLSGKIVVRLARTGEQVTLLDGQDVRLNEGTLLITDNTGPIGIAGVMGGLSTAVQETTVNIFLESAFFAPMAIAGQARAYGMHTDASHRFERGVDWQGQTMAIERATRLLLDIAGGVAGPTLETVATSALPQTRDIGLRANRIRKLLGVKIADDEIDRMLHQLHFPYKRNTGHTPDSDVTWTVRAPSHRFDIEIEADLIEEISRVYGYNRLPVTTPKTHLAMLAAPEGLLSSNRIKDQLVARGYQEAITYSFVDRKSLHVLDPENDPIGLLNPLSSEMGVMRTTLWSGLIKSLIYNVNRQQSRVRLFESGLRFRQAPNRGELTLAQISQEMMIAGVASGARYGESWANGAEPLDFFDIKGDVESLVAMSGAESEFVFSAGRHPALHPGQTALIHRAGMPVGALGLLDPRVQQALDLDCPVYLFEMRLDALMGRRIPDAVPLSRFPEVRRDIAIVVDLQITAAEIRKIVVKTAGETLTNLKLFDVYLGKGIDPNRKSIALGLTFQHPSRTLTDAEINQSIDLVVASLASGVEAVLRN